MQQLLLRAVLTAMDLLHYNLNKLQVRFRELVHIRVCPNILKLQIIL
jgi:hypothetical protein